MFTQIFKGGLLPRTEEYYVEFLIAGLIPWLGISEGVMRSTTAMIDNAPLLRKLPLSGTLVVLVTLALPGSVPSCGLEVAIPVTAPGTVSGRALAEAGLC